MLARSFPSNLTAMMFGYKVKPSFTVAERGADLGAADGELREAGVALIAQRAVRALLAAAAAARPRSSLAPALAQDVCRCRP